MYTVMESITVVTTNITQVEASLQELLAHLHALYALHRSAHWTASGASYYGDHLLFMRLYEPLDEEIDGLAERMLGAGITPQRLDANELTALTNEIVQELCAEPCPYARGMNAEKQLLQCVAHCAGLLQQEGSLTMGWEDYLGGVTAQHEEHCYLLGQRLR